MRIKNVVLVEMQSNIFYLDV